MRRFGFAALTALLVLLCVEALAWGTLFVLDRVHSVRYERIPLRDLEPLQRYVLSLLVEGQHEYIRYDETLGWTIKPGGVSDLYHANSQGLRAERDFEPEPAPGVVRIETFGDSFTHGDDVEDTETWQAQLVRLAPRLELLNFGVPAYGPGQSLLRYQEEGAQLAPDVVVLGLLSENVHRTVNTFRPFYRPPTGIPLAKPRFRLVGGQLELLENPIESVDAYGELLDHPEPVLRLLGENDYYHQLMQSRMSLDFLASVRLSTIVLTRFMTPEIVSGGEYVPDSEAFQLTVAIVEAFRRRVEADAAVPILLLYPTSTDLRNARAGRPTLHGSLLRALCQPGQRCIDLLDTFRTQGTQYAEKELIRLHNTALGNRLAAEAVLGYLREQGLDRPRH